MSCGLGKLTESVSTVAPRLFVFLNQALGGQTLDAEAKFRIAKEAILVEAMEIVDN